MRKKSVLALALLCGFSFAAKDVNYAESETVLYNKNGIVLKLSGNENGKFKVYVENNSGKDMFNIKLQSKDIKGINILDGKEISIGNVKSGEKRLLEDKEIKVKVEKAIKEAIKKDKLVKTDIPGVYKVYVPLVILGAVGIVSVLVSKKRSAGRLLSLTLGTGILMSSVFVGSSYANMIYDNTVNVSGKISVNGNIYNYAGTFVWNNSDKENTVIVPKKDEEAKKKQEEAEAKKKEKEEAKRKQEEAEAKKKQEEAEAKRKQEEAEAKRKQEEAEAKKKQEEAEAKKKQEEAEAKRKQEEAEAKKKQEEAEAKRKQEEAEAKKKQEEAEAKRKQEEAEAKRKQEEAEAKKKQEEAEAKKKQEEAEAKKKQEEEEAKRKQEEAEAKKKQEEAEAKKKQEEAEAKKKQEEAEAKKKQEEAEAKKKEKEEEKSDKSVEKTFKVTFEIRNGYSVNVFGENSEKKLEKTYEVKPGDKKTIKIPDVKMTKGTFNNEGLKAFVELKFEGEHGTHTLDKNNFTLTIDGSSDKTDITVILTIRRY